MKLLDKILWTMVVLIFGAYYGAVLSLQEAHIEHSYLREDFIIGAIAALIVFIGLSAVAYVIAKRKKAKSPYTVALITGSILVALITIQTFIN